MRETLTQGQKVWKLLLFMCLVIGIGYIVLFDGSLSELLHQRTVVLETLRSAGVWGPLLVVGLMVVAVVVSPLPSAPIALVSGALYGHTYGTAYVAIGSLIGAMIAFLLARFIGAEFVRKWIGQTRLDRIESSQGTMMAAVFLIRLVPFISFDVVSYAAGLTALRLWRFLVATLMGILPASFLLAHFGGELASEEAIAAQSLVLLMGLIILLPLVVVRLRRKGK